MSNLDRTTACSEVFEDYRLYHQFVRGQTARLDFVAVRIVGNNDPTGKYGPLIYERFVDDKQDWDCIDPALADLFLTGDIKFDGESNWDFPNGMIQFGNRYDAASLGRLIDRMYVIAADAIPGFDDGSDDRASARTAAGET